MSSVVFPFFEKKGERERERSVPDKDSMKTWKSVVVEEARGSVERLNI